MLNSDPKPTWDTENFPFKVPMLFPYWSAIDREHSFCPSSQDCLFDYSNRSAVFYQVYTEGSNASYTLERANQEVKNSTEFSDFSATWVLVVTWLRLRPKVQSVEDVKEDIVSTLKYNRRQDFWRSLFFLFDTVTVDIQFKHIYCC